MTLLGSSGNVFIAPPGEAVQVLSVGHDEVVSPTYYGLFLCKQVSGGSFATGDGMCHAFSDV
uniref:Uncharacterized protein n=1 Tax=Streptomyces nigrescens TaxID=1920 RepID=A0A3S5XEK2_STRNI|nr:unnamed protein product [Streptomyces nigrescens]